MGEEFQSHLNEQLEIAGWFQVLEGSGLGASRCGIFGKILKRYGKLVS